MESRSRRQRQQPKKEPNQNTRRPNKRLDAISFRQLQQLPHAEQRHQPGDCGQQPTGALSTSSSTTGISTTAVRIRFSRFKRLSETAMPVPYRTMGAPS